MEKRGITLEICCGGYADALAAQRGGAQRVELNSALHLGGLTPSLGALALVKERTSLKVVAMVRPRGGGFLYDDEEFAQMLRDAELLLREGADGLAFGFLRVADAVPEQREALLGRNIVIDLARTRELAQLVHSFGAEKTAVFHRAFDCASDLFGSLALLREAGIDRVLTSGGAATAWEGREVLRELCAMAAGEGPRRTAEMQTGARGNDADGRQDAEQGSAADSRRETGPRPMEILPGCGISADNAAALLAATGASQLHSSCRDWRADPTGRGERVSYGFAGAGREELYDAVSEGKVRALREAVERFR